MCDEIIGNKMAEFSLVVETPVRGYHAYMDQWETAINTSHRSPLVVVLATKLCSMASNSRFYQLLDRACTRRSHNIAYSIFSVTYRLVLFTALPRMIGRNNAKVSECLQALSTAGKCCAHWNHLQQWHTVLYSSELLSTRTKTWYCACLSLWAVCSNVC